VAGKNAGTFWPPAGFSALSTTPTGPNDNLTSRFSQLSPSRRHPGFRFGILGADQVRRHIGLNFWLIRTVFHQKTHRVRGDLKDLAKATS
jgi:hypothetical protein